MSPTGAVLHGRALHLINRRRGLALGRDQFVALVGPGKPFACVLDLALRKLVRSVAEGILVCKHYGSSALTMAMPAVAVCLLAGAPGLARICVSWQHWLAAADAALVLRGLPLAVRGSP